jgi:hypothetical protein
MSDHRAADSQQKAYRCLPLRPTAYRIKDPTGVAHHAHKQDLQAPHSRVRELDLLRCFCTDLLGAVISAVVLADVDGRVTLMIHTDQEHPAPPSGELVQRAPACGWMAPSGMATRKGKYLMVDFGSQNGHLTLLLDAVPAGGRMYASSSNSRCPFWEPMQSLLPRQHAGVWAREQQFNSSVSSPTPEGAPLEVVAHQLSRRRTDGRHGVGGVPGTHSGGVTPACFSDRAIFRR